MKNKKLLTAGTAVLLSGVLLAATALTGNAATNAYEQFKTLLSQDHAKVDNMTLHMNMTISDNNAAVLNAIADMKADTEKKMSGQFQISGAGEEKSFEVYGKDGTMLFHQTGSENWYQAAHQNEDSEDADKDLERRFSRPDMKDHEELREMFLDAMMGDLKDQVTLSESNGLRTFSLTLDEGNMPVLVKTAFSLGSRTHGDKKALDTVAVASLPQELQNVVADMAEYHKLIEISGERTLERVTIALTVDENNQPQAMAFTTNFSGVAEDGSAHDYEINCSLTLSDLNTTIVSEADVDPSAITTIDSALFENAGKCHRMHR